MSQEPMVLPETGTGERARRRRARQAALDGLVEDDVVWSEGRSRRRRGRRGAGDDDGGNGADDGRRRAHPVARWTYIGAMAVLILAIPVLTYVGMQAVGDSNAGRERDVVTDPEAPGYEADVEPTPTMLVTQTDDAGVVSGVTVLSLTSDGGGNLTFFPAGTELELPFTETGRAPLDVIYQGAGQSGLEQRVETLLVAATEENVEILSNEQWATLVAPLGPLTILNPVALNTTDVFGGPVAFAQGEIQVPPEQIGLFVNTRAPEENDLTRLERQQAFWTAWLAAVTASSDPNAVPGETDKGLGRFVRGLADGEATYNTLPVTPVGIFGVGATDSNLYLPDQAAVNELVAQTIPFPIGVGRLRVRVLDGTGTEGTAESAARVMVPAGAEIAIIGNAGSFGREEVVLQYYDPAERDQAQRLLDALGGGRLVLRESVTDSVDATVVVGSNFDAATAPGASATTVPPTTVTTAPPLPVDPFAPTTVPFGTVPAITPPTEAPGVVPPG